MSSPITTIVTLADLAAAVAGQDTDTFAICQNPAGCGDQDFLVRMSLDQLAQFVLAKVPPPPVLAYSYVSTVIDYANRVQNVPNDTVFSIANITLPAGKWLVAGEAWFVVDSGTPLIARIASMLSPTAASLLTDPADTTSLNAQEPNQSKQGGGSTTGLVLPLTPLFHDSGASGTYYLNGQVVWTGGGVISAYGKIAAWSVASQ